MPSGPTPAHEVTQLFLTSPKISPDTWTWEIRPIIDKKIEKRYLAFNPSFDKSFRGPEEHRGYEFSPNVKFSYDLTPKIAAGVKYYAAYGPVTGFDVLRNQEQQILPAVDVDFGKNWEFNFGVGVGVTQATDHLLVKAILGYRFHNGGHNNWRGGRPGDLPVSELLIAGRLALERQARAGANRILADHRARVGGVAVNRDGERKAALHLIQRGEPPVAHVAMKERWPRVVSHELRLHLRMRRDTDHVFDHASGRLARYLN